MKLWRVTLAMLISFLFLTAGSVLIKKGIDNMNVVVYDGKMFRDYIRTNGTEEGTWFFTFASREEYLKRFAETTKRVIKRSMSVEVESGKSFDRLYKHYANIFRERYSKEHEGWVGDYIMTVQELKSNGYVGDCDDYATFLYVLAKKKGVEVRYVVGGGNSGASGHAWIQIERDGRWVDYDSTHYLICDGCVSEKYPLKEYI